MYEVVDDDITGKKIVVCKPCMDDHVKFTVFYIDLQDGNSHRIVGSSTDWVNPKTIKLFFVVSAAQ